ncbi:hypothetical protein L6259_01310 [Candidatus Parcubacteria bacterium]|nr:hypothetical protein [Patescibacteria group bacterium]MCG2693903.1 hypothetical protein [Candidatus Parcubacteria bacterium]
MKKVTVLIVLLFFSGCAGARYEKCNCDTSLRTLKQEVNKDLTEQKLASARNESISREYRLLFYKLVTHVKEMQKDYNGLQARYMMLELHGAQLEKNIRDLKKPRHTRKKR